VVLPEALRPHLDALALWAPADHFQETVSIDEAAVRRAIRERRKIAFTYRDLRGKESARVVRPLIMAFYGPVWLLTGWCETREGFRVFRLDRMSGLEAREERFRLEPGKTAADFLEQDLGHRARG
jgi:predicted DNA-binding transcriptional regulator YafY